MSAERDACGFFLSGHPLDAYKSVLTAERVRTYAEVIDAGGPPSGGRSGATLAGLIEGCRWRTPPSGKRYLMIDLTDLGVGYTASCFDDGPQQDAERLCKEGQPVLIQAELLWREDEDAPRVAIRSLRPLTEVARRTPTKLDLALRHRAAADGLADLMRARRGGRTEIVARVALAGGGWAQLRLGRDFSADPDTLAALTQTPGVEIAVA